MNQSLDKDLYNRGGVVDKDLARSPLRITEKPFPHRMAAEDVTCHDCGQYIAPGEQFMVSALECTKGTKATQYRYSVHLACYDVVGRVVMILGKGATHAFEGRPPLSELWKQHRPAILGADPDLGAMLEMAFGK